MKRLVVLSNEQRVAGVILVLLGAVSLAEARWLAGLREEMVAGAVVGDDTFAWIIDTLPDVS